MARGKPWKDYEDDFLKKRLGVLSYQEIAAALGRTVSSVSSRRSKLALETERQRRDRFAKHVKLWWKTKTDKEIAEFVGRPKETIANIRRAKGLYRKKQRSWTKEEEEYIEANWRTASDRELAEEIGRTPYDVRQKRSRRGWIGKKGVQRGGQQD